MVASGGKTPSIILCDLAQEDVPWKGVYIVQVDEKVAPEGDPNRISLKDESGKIIKWYGTNIDIEDRKRGEEALRARELSWRQIVDNIPLFVATTGVMGEVEFLNRQTLDYFDKTSEELKNWALIGELYDIEHRCRRADGVYRWFQVRGLPVRDTENKMTAWYLLLTDIDDRKRAEEALESNERNLNLMINAIPALIHSALPDGYIDFLNKGWLDFFGLPLEEAVGWGWTKTFHPDDIDQYVAKWRAALASGEPFEAEGRAKRADGEYRTLLHRKVPLRNEHGNIVRWYGISFDIEDRNGRRRSSSKPTFVSPKPSGLHKQIELRCLAQEESYGSSTAIASVSDVRAFIDEYFEAWRGTDEDLILSYYAETVSLEIPGALVNGKAALRDQFVRPFVVGFPGNRHIVKNMIFGKNVVVVEWSFEADHSGPFAGRAATGTAVKLPGCGVYEFDPVNRKITTARIYFDVTTLLKQISSHQPKVLQNLLISWFASRAYPASGSASGYSSSH